MRLYKLFKKKFVKGKIVSFNKSKKDPERPWIHHFTIVLTNDIVLLYYLDVGVMPGPMREEQVRMNRSMIGTSVLVSYHLKIGRKLFGWELDRYII